MKKMFIPNDTKRNPANQAVRGIDLKILRLRTGIRQYEAASLIGIHPSRLSEAESGRRVLPPETMERLLTLLKEHGEKA